MEDDRVAGGELLELRSIPITLRNWQPTRFSSPSYVCRTRLGQAGRAKPGGRRRASIEIAWLCVHRGSAASSSPGSRSAISSSLVPHRLRRSAQKRIEQDAGGDLNGAVYRFDQLAHERSLDVISAGSVARCCDWAASS
jgi:hypothetical protein